jgi:hypothetical protein
MRLMKLLKVTLIVIGTLFIICFAGVAVVAVGTFVAMKTAG